MMLTDGRYTYFFLMTAESSYTAAVPPQWISTIIQLRMLLILHFSSALCSHIGSRRQREAPTSNHVQYNATASRPSKAILSSVIRC